MPYLKDERGTYHLKFNIISFKYTRGNDRGNDHKKNILKYKKKEN